MIDDPQIAYVFYKMLPKINIGDIKNKIESNWIVLHEKGICTVNCVPEKQESKSNQNNLIDAIILIVAYIYPPDTFQLLSS